LLLVLVVALALCWLMLGALGLALCRAAGRADRAAALIAAEGRRASRFARRSPSR